MKKEAKCIDCGKLIYIGLRASSKTCRCDECKNNHLQYIYPNKFKNGIKTSTLNCNIFDIQCENCYFKQHNICKSKSGIKYKLQTLQKYCNLNISDYESTINNYLEIKHQIQNLIDNGLSSVDICTIYFNCAKHGNTIFEILEINTRNLKESVKNAVLQGKIGCEILYNQYKCGWHETWYGKKVFLRSSYEFDYASKLDDNKIKYDVECFRIKYFDTISKRYRIAIPDFYLNDTNTLVEIKSHYTYDKENMDDKFKEYKKLGFNTKLILEHIEYDT